MATFSAGLANLPHLRTIGRHSVDYRGYQELLECWSKLPNSRTRSVGRSHQNEPIWMVEIGNPAATKVSVVMAGIHPIEWIGIETALQIAEEHAVDPCQDRRVCFFPIVNPDGFRTVEANLRAGKRRWVRTNREGVDLNRNWPTHFKSSRGFLRGLNRSGPAPLSEPEIASIVSVLDDIDQNSTIDFALSLHSIGKMILLPWGGIWKSPNSRSRHVEVAKKLRNRLRGYTIRQVSHWVPGVSFAHGMEIDHLHQRYGAISILIECTRGGLHWSKPASWLDPFRIFNPTKGSVEAVAIAHATNPFVKGEM